MRRRKPRLFSFSREVELAHYDDLIEDPAERRVLEELVDAFLTIAHARGVDPVGLSAIEAAATHDNAAIRGLGITRLTVLTHYFTEAHETLARVCTHPRADVRLFSVTALANTPESVGAPLVDRALSDAEWTVRKAAGRALTAVLWPSAVTSLEAALERERDARVKVVLQLARDHQARNVV